MERAIQGMSNLDYFFLCAELRKELVGARLNQAYDAPNGFRLRFQKNGALNLWVELGVRMHLAQSVLPAPASQSSFVKLLRQQLDNARVESVEQLGFDRIVKIEFAGRALRFLVFEQFDKGNVIATDEQNVIIRPLRGRESVQRQLHKKLAYSFPASTRVHPLTVAGSALAEGVGESESVKDVLSRKVELAPFYSEEACARAKVEFRGSAGTLAAGEWERLALAVKGLVAEPASPRVYFAGQAAHAFSPLPLAKFAGKGFAEKEFPSFSRALEAYYGPLLVEQLEKEAGEGKASEREKLERVRADQQAARTRLQEHSLQLQEGGEWVHANLHAVQGLLAQAGALRKEGKDAKEMESALASLGELLGVRVKVPANRLTLELERKEEK